MILIFLVPKLISKCACKIVHVQGDVGAPLVCFSLQDAQYRLVGLLSGGVDCGVPGLPDLFTSTLESTINWLQSVRQKLNRDRQQDNKAALNNALFSTTTAKTKSTATLFSTEKQVVQSEKTPQEESLKPNFDELEIVLEVQQTTEASRKDLVIIGEIQPTTTSSIISYPQPAAYQDQNPNINFSMLKSNLDTTNIFDIQDYKYNKENDNQSHFSREVVLPFEHVKLRPFQHSDNDYDYVDPFAVITDNSNSNRRDELHSLVSPSYSSILKFRPNKQPKIPQEYYEEENDQLCLGYENFGSGGVSNSLKPKLKSQMVLKYLYKSYLYYQSII